MTMVGEEIYVATASRDARARVTGFTHAVDRSVDQLTHRPELDAKYDYLDFLKNDHARI